MSHPASNRLRLALLLASLTALTLFLAAPYILSHIAPCRCLQRWNQYFLALPPGCTQVDQDEESPPGAAGPCAFLAREPVGPLRRVLDYFGSCECRAYWHASDLHYPVLARDFDGEPFFDRYPNCFADVSVSPGRVWGATSSSTTMSWELCSQFCDVVVPPARQSFDYGFHRGFHVALGTERNPETQQVENYLCQCWSRLSAWTPEEQFLDEDACMDPCPSNAAQSCGGGSRPNWFLRDYPVLTPGPLLTIG